MAESDTYESLFSSALRFVSYRPRSLREIKDFARRFLAKHKSDQPDISAQVMSRLIDLGYADDVKFSRWWITARRSTKPKGRRLIKIELTAKGVNKEIIDEVLASEQPDGDPGSGGDTGPGIELAAARKAVLPKLRIYQNLPVIERKRKIYALLLRRGFDYDVAGRVIDEICGKDYNNDG